MPPKAGAAGSRHSVSHRSSGSGSGRRAGSAARADSRERPASGSGRASPKATPKARASRADAQNASLPAAAAPAPAKEKLRELGWVYCQDGRLRKEDGALYSREDFTGDYDELKIAIADFVVEGLQRPPWELQCMPFKEDAPEGVSRQCFASRNALSHTGPLLLLLPGIGARAGVWSCSLCACDSLGRGAMFEFLAVAASAGMAQVIFDPAGSDPYDGEAHVRHCVQAWCEVIEKSAASEFFIVAHSFAGASLIDMLAVASEAALARIRGIAFTDSVHFVGPDCLQLRKGGLPPAAHEVLREHAVFWQADESPVDTLLWEFNEDRGCRVVSAGVKEHASTNAFACCSIFRHFASQALEGLVLPENMEHIEREVRALAGGAGESGAAESVRRVFQEWDLDGNGTISEDELAHVIHLLHPSIPPEALNALFLELDKKKDGQIDYDAFVSWMYDSSSDEPTSDAKREKPSPRKASRGGATDLRHGLMVQKTCSLPGGIQLCISSGNIINFTGDAIVNAANRGCCGGGGVDGAISRAGGPELLAARKKLPIVKGTPGTRCPTGEARITIGGHLKSRFCIHAVGPHYGKDLAEGDRLLESAYCSAMACAEEKKLQSVAFSILSGGIFKGKQTLERITEVAVEGVMAGAYEGLKEVHIVGFQPDELRALQKACDTIVK